MLCSRLAGEYIEQLKGSMLEKYDPGEVRCRNVGEDN
jgi:hypothetical protein